MSLRTQWQRLQQWARALKRDVVALYLAARDPRVPWGAKVVAGAVAAYAISPIDLIPDFIPFIGYLDDLLLAAVVMDGLLNFVDRSLLHENPAKR